MPQDVSGHDDRSTSFLLVEDDDSHAMMVQFAFGEDAEDASLAWAKSGEEALDTLRDQKRRPDVVLLDLKLPGLDGFDVLRELKTDPELHNIPVVILTTSDAHRDHARADELGANSYVVKPVGFEQFCETVRAIKKYWIDHHYHPTRFS